MNEIPAGDVSDLGRVLFSAQDLAVRVKDLARVIEQAYEGRDLSVLALMDGALFFVADLVRCMSLPLRLHTLSVSSYHGGTSSVGAITFNGLIPEQLVGTDILVIDDILDSGLTLATLKARLIAEAKPASLKIAVLLSKVRERAQDVSADFVGFEIPDEFVVGYGMDYEGRYRNLPCIRVLNTPSAESSL